MTQCNIVGVTEHFGILWLDKIKNSCFYQARGWNRKYFLKSRIIPTILRSVITHTSYNISL